MVFIISNYSSLKDLVTIQKKYNLQNDATLFCGTTTVEIDGLPNVPYHPLVNINFDATDKIKIQQHYLDNMLRAIQIEVPEKIIIDAPTLIDNSNIIEQIKIHAATVGVAIIEN